MREKLIVALDTDPHTALSLARTLQGRVAWVKVGMTLFYAEGPEIVKRLRDMGFSVFLDLKAHDIPHQVRGAAREMARLGVGMFTVHASGGAAMMMAAAEGACEGSAECGLDTPSVLAVTVLTSLSDSELAAIGIPDGTGRQVSRLASLAKASGVQGVVCSPQEAAAMRESLGPEHVIVTPGIRPAWADAGDQARVATPSDAVAAGASYLVVGRPITASDRPAVAVERIVTEG